VPVIDARILLVGGRLGHWTDCDGHAEFKKASSASAYAGMHLTIIIKKCKEILSL
jgi:hypothetical protein